MLSLNDRKKSGDIDAYESYIPGWSPLIGKRVDEIMKRYEDKIIIDHLHNSPLEIGTRRIVSSKTLFEKGMSVKIFGDWKDICSFTTKYDLP